MASKPVGHKALNIPDFVLADVQSLHDHSYATDDSVRIDIKHINETCQKILKNQSTIMKDLELIKHEFKIGESHDYETDNITKHRKIPKQSNQKEAQTTSNKIRIKLPCSSIEELENLEAKIQNNESFESFMIQYFERIEQYELPKFIKSAFEAIMTEEVAKCYTWCGLNNNRCIKDFKLVSILMDIANQKFSQAPNEITINFMKKYFVRCKDKSRKKQLKELDSKAYKSESMM